MNLVKVPYVDYPNRCQRMVMNSQCSFIAMEGQIYCELHAIAAKKQEKAKDLRNYNLTKWKGQVNQFADNSQIKSLREEAGILRMTLETLLNRYTTDDDLLMIMPKVLDLTDRIGKMVSIMHKLDSSLGQLLDKQQIIQLAMEISKIISDYVTDPVILEQISTAISLTLDRVGNN